MKRKHNESLRKYRRRIKMYNLAIANYLRGVWLVDNRYKRRGTGNTLGYQIPAVTKAPLKSELYPTEV